MSLEDPLIQKLRDAGVQERLIDALVLRSRDCPYISTALKCCYDRCYDHTRTPADVFAEIALALSEQNGTLMKHAIDVATYTAPRLLVAVPPKDRESVP